MSDESQDISGVLYSTLSSDATITAYVSSHIYDTIIPQSVDDNQDCLVYQQQSSIDTNSHSGDRIIVSPLWLVKVVGGKDKSFDEISPIFDRADELLKILRISAGGRYYALTRQDSNVRFPEPIASGGYRFHRGGVYRVIG